MKTQNRSTASVGERGMAARVALVVALSLTLLGVMRWAMNVTDANARQISHNLTRMKQHLDDDETHATPMRNGRIGPTLDPERGTSKGTTPLTR